MGLSIYFFFFNLFLIGRGYSETQLGLLTGAMAAGNITGALPAARLIRRAGLRKALLTCQIVAPIVLCLRALLPVFSFQIALAILTGMTLSLWAVCISPTVAAVTGEQERPFAFSLLFSMGIGVGAIGALIGSRMPGYFVEAFGRSEALAPDQLTLIAACCLAALSIVPMTATRFSRPFTVARARPFFSPALLRFLPAVAVWGLVVNSLAPFSSVFLSAHFRLPLRRVGAVFSIAQLLQVCGVLLAPFLFRRWGIPTGIFGMQIVTGLCFLILALGTPTLPGCITFIVLTAAQWMGEPGIYSLLMSIAPEEHRGGASASMALVLASSQLVAATSAGWAFAHWGYPRTLGLIAFVAMFAGVLFKATNMRQEVGLVPHTSELHAD